jgi:hypothetical protein
MRMRICVVGSCSVVLCVVSCSQSLNWVKVKLSLCLPN